MDWLTGKFLVADNDTTNITYGVGQLHASPHDGEDERSDAAEEIENVESAPGDLETFVHGFGTEESREKVTECVCVCARVCI